MHLNLHRYGQTVLPKRLELETPLLGSFSDGDQVPKELCEERHSFQNLQEEKSKYSLSGRYDCKSRPASSSGLAFTSSHPVYRMRRCAVLQESHPLF